MQANSQYHKIFHFHVLFWTWKVWEGGGKLQKIEYLVNEKTFSKFLIGNHIMEKKKKNGGYKL